MELTNKQKEIFEIIKEYINKNNYSPTVRELCEISGLKSTSTIFSYLIILEEKGYITQEKGKYRTIRIKEEFK